MELNKALEIANRVKDALTPYCDRIEIAGSIRRRKPEVHDIEIVCIPKMQIIGGKPSVLSGFASIVMQWKKVKGEPGGKYTCRELPEGINLDLFMTTADSWGYIYAIRTGSAEFSHRVLACGWVKKGYHGKEGILYDQNYPLRVPEEEDQFKLIGMDYVEPDKREVFITN